MSDIEIYEGTAEEDYDDQIREALQKSLEIYGTVMNDLELAINTASNYQRAFDMLGAPDPNDVAMGYLLQKYNMARESRAKTIEGLKAIANKARPELEA